MTRYLLAGGGTAGHVNPLLAVADRLCLDDPLAEVLALGTAEGIEARLVPERGYELITIEKVPMPRRLNLNALKFPSKFLRAVREIRELIRERDIEIVVGFGGFVSAPAYLASWREKRPIVIHEANAVPGFANRLGCLFTDFVGVAFSGTKLRRSRIVGMPLSQSLETLDRSATRLEALQFFGFTHDRNTLLVTGGSLGARDINETVSKEIANIIGAGWNVLHIVGSRSELNDGGIPGYRVVSYCDRMDLAFAVAELAVTRAGSATVSELTALGIPAVYVPLPVGNGEQQRNVAGVVSSGGAIMVKNAQFTREWVNTVLVPLLHDSVKLAQMSAIALSQGVRDGTSRTVALIAEALAQSKAVKSD